MTAKNLLRSVVQTVFNLFISFRPKITKFKVPSYDGQEIFDVYQTFSNFILD